RHSFAKAAEQRIPLWQDAAVRKLAMEERSPLYILSPQATRLDDISTTTHICSAQQAAYISAAIARRLHDTAPEVPNIAALTDEDQALVDNIVQAIAAARQPLI